MKQKLRMVVVVAGLIALGNVAYGENRIYSGGTKSVREWNRCIEAKEQVDSSQTLLQFRFQAQASGFVTVDNRKVEFEGVREVSVSGQTLSKGKHSVKLTLENPAIIQFVLADARMALCSD